MAGPPSWCLAAVIALAATVVLRWVLLAALRHWLVRYAAAFRDPAA